MINVDIYQTLIHGSKRMNKEFMLEGQKIIADTVAVPLSKEDLELRIDKLCDGSISDKRTLSLYQKLTRKLETLEAFAPSGTRK